ncbi:MAG TPA: c-type cytochrome [Pyrinomonadaceae bacterium]|nr:c-type cytochrome [Pyrinomonadaceae bacterium]
MKKRLIFAWLAIGTVAGVSTICFAVGRLPVFTSARGDNARSFQAKPFDQAQALADLNKRIAGQESKPAAEVFKNIQILKGMPAGRLLKVMEIGYARSLGVTCEHCHVAGDWEKDDKPTKQIAREMVGMANTINSELLKNIKNLKGPNSIVNCTTCHRGQVKPALNLPETKS